MLDALVDTLARETGPVSVIETHISAVLLTGERAYKLKKPVNLGFLDFTRLRQRRHFCREELRLNRRLAPDLYLSVLPITGTAAAPRLGGSGRAIDAGDASEANLAVLNAQRARYRPLGAEEEALVIVIDTSRPYAESAAFADNASGEFVLRCPQ